MSKLLAITARALHDRRVSLIVFCLAGGFIPLMYVVMFPTFQEESETFEQVLGAVPEQFFAAFGLEGGDLGFDSLERFLAIEQYSIITPLILIFLVAGFAGWALAREIEKGTIEQLLAKPIHRMTLFFGRYLSGLVALAVFVLASAYIPPLLAAILDVDFTLKNYGYIAVVTGLFGWAIFSFAMMVSAMVSEKSKATMTIGGVMVAMYLANVAARLLESLEWLQYTSFFYYYDHNAALVETTISNETIAVFAAVIVGCTAIGALWFQRRDIAT